MNGLAEDRLRRLAVSARFMRGIDRSRAVRLPYHRPHYVCAKGHAVIRKRKTCPVALCKSPVTHLPGKCRLCEQPLSARRTSWCSEECANSYYLVTSSSVLRYHIYRRDRGVCATCNTDCAALEVRVYGYDTMLKLPKPQSSIRRPYYMVTAMREEMRNLGFNVGNNRSFWDADHVVALEEGGDWRIENVQTLCVPCHKEKTAEHTERRARIKRVIGKKHVATKRSRLLAGGK